MSTYPFPQVTDQTKSVSTRIAAAQAYLTACTINAFLLTATATNSSAIAAPLDAAWGLTLGANHAALYQDITALIDASNLVIGNSAVSQAMFVLSTVQANSPHVMDILTAQEVYIASHAAALAVTIAGHAAACAVQVRRVSCAQRLTIR